MGSYVRCPVHSVHVFPWAKHMYLCNGSFFGQPLLTTYTCLAALSRVLQGSNSRSQPPKYPQISIRHPSIIVHCPSTTVKYPPTKGQNTWNCSAPLMVAFGDPEPFAIRREHTLTVHGLGKGSLPVLSGERAPAWQCAALVTVGMNLPLLPVHLHFSCLRPRKASRWTPVVVECPRPLAVLTPALLQRQQVQFLELRTASVAVVFGSKAPHLLCRTMAPRIVVGTSGWQKMHRTSRRPRRRYRTGEMAFGGGRAGLRE